MPSYTTALRPQWVLFGDSITQRGFGAGGWAAALADTYQRRVDVINRGYSGWNTRLALPLLDRVFPAGSGGTLQLATVWFGANDAALPDRTSAKQHVPLEEYTSNLRAVVAHIQALDAPAIVLVTPPPVSEPDRIKHVLATYNVALDHPERTNEAAGRYAAACRALGAELGLPVVDLWGAFQEEADWGTRLLCDGLHLTPEGNARAGALVEAAIAARWPALRPEAMRWDVPELAVVAAAEDPPALLAAHFAEGGAIAKLTSL